MTGHDPPPEEQYSNLAGFIFIFNLIVGAGVLSLPNGFNHAGVIPGMIFLAAVALASYISATWVIEAMATANAVLHWHANGAEDADKDAKQLRDSTSERTPLLHGSGMINSMPALPVHASFSEDLAHAAAAHTLGAPVDPLASSVNAQGDPAAFGATRAVGQRHSIQAEAPDAQNPFEIVQVVEMGRQSELFMGKIGQRLFYTLIVVYLFPDLAIYVVGVPKSVLAVTGTFGLDYYVVYRIYVACFAAIVIPFTLMNFQKTKYLQTVTVMTRNVALVAMITLALVFLGEGRGNLDFPGAWVRPIQGLPGMMGATVYAFMCHYSLPGIVTPMRNKRVVLRVTLAAWLFIFVVYALLCNTAVLAYGQLDVKECSASQPECKIQPLYTLNFAHYPVKFLAVFLQLYPAFALTTNFPLMAITLRNNLMVLITYKADTEYQTLRRICFALASALPPIMVALATDNVSFLVTLTGGYGGLGIEFLMPALLLVFSRRRLQQLHKRQLVDGAVDSGWVNPYRSPFGARGWVYAVLALSAGMLGVVSYNILNQLIRTGHLGSD